MTIWIIWQVSLLDDTSGPRCLLGGASTGNANHRYIRSDSSGYGTASGIGGGGALDVEAFDVHPRGTSILAAAFRRAIYAKHYFCSTKLKFPQIRVTCMRLLFVSSSYPYHHLCADRKPASVALNCINANGTGCII